jgi:tRNA A37 N6-isopentenylltransferase MiaA
VRYHMIDFVDPAASFNAAEYVEGARATIDHALRRRPLRWVQPHRRAPEP